MAKLIAFRETESDKHLRDARGILITLWGDLDLEAIRHGAHAARMFERLEELLKDACRELEEQP